MHVRPAESVEGEEQIGLAGLLLLAPLVVASQVLRLFHRQIHLSGVPKAMGGDGVHVTIRPVRY